MGVMGAPTPRFDLELGTVPMSDKPIVQATFGGGALPEFIVHESLGVQDS